MFCLLMLIPCGSGNQRRESQPSFLSVRANSRLRELNTLANSLFAARRYSEAAETNRKAYESAMAENAVGAATRFLLNLAGCSFGLMKYGDALDAYIRARELAESAGDWEAAAAASLNLSSLHLQLSEMDGAYEEARRGLALLDGRGDRVGHDHRHAVHPVRAAGVLPVPGPRPCARCGPPEGGRRRGGILAAAGTAARLIVRYRCNENAWQTGRFSFSAATLRGQSCLGGVAFERAMDGARPRIGAGCGA